MGCRSASRIANRLRNKDAACLARHIAGREWTLAPDYFGSPRGEELMVGDLPRAVSLRQQHGETHRYGRRLPVLHERGTHGATLRSSKGGKEGLMKKKQMLIIGLEPSLVDFSSSSGHECGEGSRRPRGRPDEARYPGVYGGTVPHRSRRHGRRLSLPSRSRSACSGKMSANDWPPGGDVLKTTGRLARSPPSRRASSLPRPRLQRVGY